MLVLVFVLIVGTLATPPSFTAPSSTSGRLSITISLRKNIFTPQEAIPVIITIRNESNSTIAIYPSFSPIRDSGSPSTLLLFDITGPNGLPIEREGGDARLAKPKEVERSDFREISPGWFFGGPIYVNRPPFAYKLSRPGTYQIRAQVVFTAREWLQKNEDPSLEDRLSFPDGFLEQGSIGSNVIEITVIPSSPKATSSSTATAPRAG